MQNISIKAKINIVFIHIIVGHVYIDLQRVPKLLLKKFMIDKCHRCFVSPLNDNIYTTLIIVIVCVYM